MANKNNALTKSLYPSKTVINFINQDKEKANWRKASVFIIALPLLALFVYFGFIVPHEKLNDALELNNERLNELIVLQEYNQDYFDVQSEYNVRLNHFMSDEERSYDNRDQMLNMVFDNLTNGISIISITVEDDEMVVIVKASTLNVVGDYLDMLNEDTRSYYASVDIANENNDDDSDDIIATYRVVWNSEFNINGEGGEA
ncbi:MAG: hypothetical protein MJ094_04610 [Saccharofermentans sp.]|nr:hypothetical protein [Saccharofermentans sp.]